MSYEKRMTACWGSTDPVHPATFAIAREADAEIATLRAELKAVRGRYAKAVVQRDELKRWVIVMACCPTIPNEPLLPLHYDVLEWCGGRMADFTRGDGKGLDGDNETARALMEKSDGN